MILPDKVAREAVVLTSTAHVAVGVAGLVERRLAVLGQRQVRAGQRVHTAVEGSRLQRAALQRALRLQCLLARKVFEAGGAHDGDGGGDGGQAEGHGGGNTVLR